MALVGCLSRGDYFCAMVNQPTPITSVSLMRESVRIVARGLRSGESRVITMRKLRALGVPNQFIEDTFLTIESGLKNGVLAVVTNGLSAKGHKRGESELYDVAFDAGYKTFKRMGYLGWLRRLAILFGIVAAILTILYLLKRGF
jgi:hypothetical protein